MIINTNSYDSSVSLKTDICILGAGVAGIVLAKELQTHFKEIALVEAGDINYSAENQSIYAAESQHGLYPDPLHSRLRMLGGTSNHWENGTEPFDPIDFEEREWIDNSGWPISYLDIEKYYADAENYCNVGGDGYDTNYWVKLLGEHDIFAKTNNIDSCISKDAYPPVRFYEKYGAEINSSENITLYKNANVTDVSFDNNSSSIKSITFFSNKSIQHSISANIFIMCFGGIENARMLLEFNNKNDNRLGNKHDNVGRYFMDHPTIRAAHLYPFDRKTFSFYKGYDLGNRLIAASIKLSKSALEKNKTLNMRIMLRPGSNISLSHGVSSLHTLSEEAFPDNFGTHLTNIVKDLDLIVDKFSRKRYDTPLFDRSDEFHGFQLLAMMEQTPNRNNRIKLGSQRDKFNIRRIIIDYDISQSDKNMAWKSLNIIANEIGSESLGRVRLLREQEDRIWSSQLGFGSHHNGTTRMSDTEKTGVVDSNQKVFGTNNFYISGSSVFTTGSHTRPTLTIVALTLRLAEHIKSRYQP